jgi:hypothetical protein
MPVDLDALAALLARSGVSRVEFCEHIGVPAPIFQRALRCGLGAFPSELSERITLAVERGTPDIPDLASEKRRINSEIEKNSYA